jgi:hypothetical protein
MRKFLVSLAAVAVALAIPATASAATAAQPTAPNAQISNLSDVPSLDGSRCDMVTTVTNLLPGQVVHVTFKGVSGTADAGTYVLPPADSNGRASIGFNMVGVQSIPNGSYMEQVVEGKGNAKDGVTIRCS